MARLNIQLDSDDDLPELSSILASRIEGAITKISKNPKQEPSEIPFEEGETQSLINNDRLTETHAVAPKTLTGVFPYNPQPREQQPPRHRKQAYDNSFFLPMSNSSTGDPEGKDDYSEETFDSLSSGTNSGRLRKGTANYTRRAQVSANTHEAIHHDDCSYADFSDFVVPDSASDKEVLASRSPKKKKSRSPNKLPTARLQEAGVPLSRQPQANVQQPFRTSNSILLEKENRSEICQESSPSDEPFRSELADALTNPDDRLMS